MDVHPAVGPATITVTLNLSTHVTGEKFLKIEAAIEQLRGVAEINRNHSMTEMKVVVDVGSGVEIQELRKAISDVLTEMKVPTENPVYI